MVEVVKGKATEKYDVGEIIGRGKFSTVKLCTEKDTGKEFAVKILRTARRGCSRDAILNEVRIMNMCVDCMYVLKLVEVFDGGREFHLVEELAECGDLYSRCLAEENHAEENEVRNYIRQLIDALVFIHERNIVHCDIKPENVLVTRDDTDNIRLVDFGLARVVSPKDKVCEIVGTTEYVAPEILSFEPIMAACDMWSLGVLAYTLLSGISPFLGDNDSETYANISHCDYDFDDEVFDHVSEDAQHFISELLEVKPRIRPSAHEMSTHSWMQATIQSPSTSMSTSNTCVVSSSSSVGGVSASTSTTSTSTAIAGGASSSKIDSPIATDGTASSTHKVLTPVNSNQNNLCSSAKTTPTGSPVVSSSSGAFTRGESTRNLSVTVDQSSRGGGSAPNSARRLVGNQHIGVERAASLPVRDRSRLAIDIFSSQDEGANDSMTSATTGNSPTLDTAPDLRETPSAVDSAYMSRHRRSQSCKSESGAVTPPSPTPACERVPLSPPPPSSSPPLSLSRSPLSSVVPLASSSTQSVSNKNATIDSPPAAALQADTKNQQPRRHSSTSDNRHASTLPNDDTNTPPSRSNTAKAHDNMPMGDAGDESVAGTGAVNATRPANLALRTTSTSSNSTTRSISGTGDAVGRVAERNATTSRPASKRHSMPAVESPLSTRSSCASSVAASRTRSNSRCVEKDDRQGAAADSNAAAVPDRTQSPRRRSTDAVNNTSTSRRSGSSQTSMVSAAAISAAGRRSRSGSTSSVNADVSTATLNENSTVTEKTPGGSRRRRSRAGSASSIDDVSPAAKASTVVPAASPILSHSVSNQRANRTSSSSSTSLASGHHSTTLAASGNLSPRRRRVSTSSPSGQTDDYHVADASRRSVSSRTGSDTVTNVDVSRRSVTSRAGSDTVAAADASAVQQPSQPAASCTVISDSSSVAAVDSSSNTSTQTDELPSPSVTASSAVMMKDRAATTATTKNDSMSQAASSTKETTHSTGVGSRASISSTSDRPSFSSVSSADDSAIMSDIELSPVLVPVQSTPEKKSSTNTVPAAAAASRGGDGDSNAAVPGAAAGTALKLGGKAEKQSAAKRTVSQSSAKDPVQLASRNSAPRTVSGVAATATGSNSTRSTDQKERIAANEQKDKQTPKDPGQQRTASQSSASQSPSRQQQNSSRALSPAAQTPPRSSTGVSPRLGSFRGSAMSSRFSNSHNDVSSVGKSTCANDSANRSSDTVSKKNNTVSPTLGLASTPSPAGRRTETRPPSTAAKSPVQEKTGTDIASAKHSASTATTSSSNSSGSSLASRQEGRSRTTTTVAPRATRDLDASSTPRLGSFRRRSVSRSSQSDFSRVNKFPDDNATAPAANSTAKTSTQLSSERHTPTSRATSSSSALSSRFSASQSNLSRAGTDASSSSASSRRLVSASSTPRVRSPVDSAQLSSAAAVEPSSATLTDSTASAITSTISKDSTGERLSALGLSSRLSASQTDISMRSQRSSSGGGSSRSTAVSTSNTPRTLSPTNEHSDHQGQQQHHRQHSCNPNRLHLGVSARLTASHSDLSYINRSVSPSSSRHLAPVDRSRSGSRSRISRTVLGESSFPSLAAPSTASVSPLTSRVSSTSRTSSPVPGAAAAGRHTSSSPSPAELKAPLEHTYVSWRDRLKKSAPAAAAAGTAANTGGSGGGGMRRNSPSPSSTAVDAVTDSGCQNSSTARDSGCQNSSTARVQSPAPTTVSVANDVVCSGEYDNTAQASVTDDSHLSPSSSSSSTGTIGKRSGIAARSNSSDSGHALSPEQCPESAPSPPSSSSQQRQPGSSEENDCAQSAHAPQLRNDESNDVVAVADSSNQDAAFDSGISLDDSPQHLAEEGLACDNSGVFTSSRDDRHADSGAVRRASDTTSPDNGNASHTTGGFTRRASDLGESFASWRSRVHRSSTSSASLASGICASRHQSPPTRVRN